jgi:hypothetical protein
MAAQWCILCAAHMTIDWFTFIPALVLLLTPADLFHSSKVRYRDLTRDWDGYFFRALAHGMHTIDLVRAALGTWLLIESLHGAKQQVLFLQGGIRIFAVLLQTTVCREKDSLNAPFTFVTGLVLGDTTSLIPALFAVAVALPVALGSRVSAAYFPVLAGAYLGVGFWFKGKGSVLGLGSGAIAALLPFLWAIMFRRDLVAAYRAKRQLEEDTSPLR